MWKRICAYIIGIPVLSFGLLYAYSWYNVRQIRAQVAKELEPFIAEEIAQKNALESLGNVELSLSDLTVAKAEEKLHQPVLRLPGAQNSTRLGWACGAQRCAIWMFFLVPFGQETPTTMAPAALIVNGPVRSGLRHLAIGGVYLGETVEEMQKSCQNRGYGPPIGSNRIRWDKDWTLMWGDVNGRISLLSFINDKMLEKTEADGTENSAGADDGRKRPSK